ncbi:MAG: hypothetical protein K0Q66_1643 [Chitinophagaceae bacterium]|nr:hypothetical protein [Chitinophagaceae bacterium]
MAVQFTVGDSTHYASIPYSFLHKEGESTQVIYEASDPSKAQAYDVLGYWISFGEVLGSLAILLVLYFVAHSITSNPTPVALLEEQEGARKKPRKPKYDL